MSGASADERPADPGDWTFGDVPSALGRPRRRPIVVAVVTVVLTAAAGSTVLLLLHATRQRAAVELCERSETAVGAGRYQEAFELADEAIRRQPDHAPAYARRARARYFLGDEHGALADCDEAIRRDPRLAVAYAYRAPVARLRASPATGILDAEQALELDPAVADGSTCLALARLAAGDRAGALAAATVAVTADPADSEAHRIRGLALEAAGDDAARSEFDAAVETSHRQPYYLIARANHLVWRAAAQSGVEEQASLAQAETDVSGALNADPNFAPAHLANALVLAARGRPTDARAACERATELGPRLVDAYLFAAEDLSPKRLRRFRQLTEVAGTVVDMRRVFNGGDLTFGEVLDQIGTYVTRQAGVTDPVVVDLTSFPPEQRMTLMDCELNPSLFYDASGEAMLPGRPLEDILEMMCHQVGAVLYVTPEHITIVSAESATRPRRARPPQAVTPADLAGRERRRQMLDRLLDTPLAEADVRSLRALRDRSIGAVLTALQLILARRAAEDVRIYIALGTFPPELRATFRDVIFRWEAVPPTVRSPREVLEALTRQFAADPKDPTALSFRATPDFIEVSGPGWEDDDFRPRTRGTPVGPARPQALQWLDLGLLAVPESVELYLSRGQLRLDRVELDEAIDDFSRAVELNPGDPRAYRLRSIAYSARGRPGDEAKARADALASEP